MVELCNVFFTFQILFFHCRCVTCVIARRTDIFFVIQINFFKRSCLIVFQFNLFLNSNTVIFIPFNMGSELVPIYFLNKLRLHMHSQWWYNIHKHADTKVTIPQRKGSVRVHILWHCPIYITKLPFLNVWAHCTYILLTCRYQSNHWFLNVKALAIGTHGTMYWLHKHADTRLNLLINTKVYLDFQVINSILPPQLSKDLLEVGLFKPGLAKTSGFLLYSLPSPVGNGFYWVILAWLDNNSMGNLKYFEAGICLYVHV